MTIYWPSSSLARSLSRLNVPQTRQLYLLIVIGSTECLILSHRRIVDVTSRHRAILICGEISTYNHRNYQKIVDSMTIITNLTFILNASITAIVKDRRFERSFDNLMRNDKNQFICLLLLLLLLHRLRLCHKKFTTLLPSLL